VAASILQLQRVAPSQVQYLASIQIRAINQTNVAQCKVMWADIWHIAGNLSVRLLRGHAKGFAAGSYCTLKPPFNLTALPIETLKIINVAKKNIAKTLYTCYYSGSCKHNDNSNKKTMLR
jgi:hypothetical protein